MLTVNKQHGKYRVVVKETRKLFRNDRGTVVDGGGHAERTKALRQVGHIADGYARKLVRENKE